MAFEKMQRISSRQTRYFVQMFTWTAQRELIMSRMLNAANEDAAIKRAIAHTGDPASDDDPNVTVLFAAGISPFEFRDLTPAPLMIA